MPGFSKLNRFLPAKTEQWADIAVLLLITLYLVSWFPPHLLFSPTVAGGGDTPTHYYTAPYLKNILLPHRQISGWTPAHYAGFPLLELYFPLPFLLMVGMSFLVAMPIAFKLGTVMGIFLLPFSAYACMRFMRHKFPVPALAAVGMLPFLFLESNTFWGGNIPSVLAGEFSYSLGLALSIAWLGLLHLGIVSKRYIAANAILLALIGFSHGYSLLFAGVASLYFLFARKNFSNHLFYLARVHGLAILLLSFWLIPLLAHLKWTTALVDMLSLQEWKNICPEILWPTLFLSVCAVVFKRASTTAYLSSIFASGALLFLIGPALGVVDFRFVPFAQASLSLLGAVGLGSLTRFFRGKILLPFLAFIGSILWVGHNVKFISDWVQWNYSGLQARSTWPVFSGINDFLKGSAQDPRVFFEHSDRNEALGSLRAWECIPVFSGRSILEGAYHQSSPSTPFIFYLESEVSKSPACPFPDYGCTGMNPERAKRHFDLFNVKDVIVVSDESKAAFAKTEGYRPEFSLGPYRIFERTGPHHYVVPLEFEPVLWVGKEGWKQISYAWFRNDRINDVPLVFAAQGPNERDMDRFSLISADLMRVPRQRIVGAQPVSWEKISEEEIQFETPTPNMPYLIKVSYHPNWRVEGADKIYLISPSMMMVYPNRSRVRLYYARSRPEWLGLILTLFGIGLAVFAARRPKPFNFSPDVFAYLWLPTLLIFGIVFSRLAIPAYRLRKNSSWTALDQGIRYKNEKNWMKSEAIFRQLILARPSSYFAEQSQYYLASSEYSQNHYASAFSEFEHLVNYYSNSPFEAEAYYRMIICSRELRRPAQAKQLTQLLLTRFPESGWAGSARGGKWEP